MLNLYPAYREGPHLYSLTALGDSCVSSTAHKNPLYKKGQWVTCKRRGQAMRVQRDQKSDGPDTYTVWCEWADGGYHLETHDELEVKLMPQADWPDDALLMQMDDADTPTDELRLARAPGVFNE